MMALDELLLARAGAGASEGASEGASALAFRPTLRLYAWDPPALSIGWFQPREPFEALAASAGAALVRRPTGGGAIHHDSELTFCLVARPGEDGYPAEVVPAYEAVHAALAAALAAVGVRAAPRGGGLPLSTRPRAATLCFADHTALDLVDEAGRKLAGSAQRRRDGAVLHHGSLPLDAPALTPGSGSASLAAGRAVSWDELADAVAAAFAERLCGPLDEEPLGEEERRAAEALAARRSGREVAGARPR